jgi:hypothetical protein
MRKIIKTTAIFTLFFIEISAQDINWRSVGTSQNHFIAAKFGGDYGLFSGLSYGLLLPGNSPTLFMADLSTPFGKVFLDDWKIRVSVQREIWHQGCFSVGIKPGIILRRQESSVATLLNMGIDLTLAAGYSSPKWLVLAKANYDQTIATHINHHFLKENYLGIYNGWIGATGGNFKFGLHIARSFGKNMISLELGKAYARNFSDNPTLPFYFELTFGTSIVTAHK